MVAPSTERRVRHMRDTYVRPAGTSWSAVVGGWIAAIGAAALVAPLIAAILTGRPAVPNDLALAVPVVLGLMIAYLIGGYVAGRMAGYNTSWHGLMTARSEEHTSELQSRE